MVEPTPETRRYWSALADGTLTAERCTRCGTTQPYPKRFCEQCGAEEREVVDLGATAVIYSYSVVARAPDGFYLQPPYAVAIVEVPDGHRMVASVSADLDALAIGDTVVLSPVREGDHVFLHYERTEPAT